MSPKDRGKSACNEAALRIRNDHDTIVTLEQRLRAIEEQVEIVKVRADAAENRIADYVNELAKVNSHCDAQVAEMSAVLQTQRGQINDVGFQNTRATNELAQCRFDLERHTQLAMSMERELQSANRRVQGLTNENQLAAQHHRSSLHAAEQMLERACIKDGSSKADSDRELAEAQINLGKLQNELSEGIRQVAEYNSELQKYTELAQSAEVDRNRLVIQHNNDQNEVIQLTDRVNDLENRVRENNAKVEGPDDGHFIVKRAHVEIQSARHEIRVAREELAAERRD